MKTKNITFRQRTRGIYQKGGLLIIAVAMCVLFTVLTGGIFIRPSNITNVLIQSSVNGVAAMGVTVVILTGGIDLSVGGIGIFAALLGGMLMRDGMSWPPAVLIMLVLGVIWGIANGISVAKFKMNPFIVTLAIMNITKGIAFVLSKGYTVYGFPKGLAVFGQGRFLFMPVAGLIFIATTIIMSIVLNRTQFGRNIYAIGGNANASWLSGIDVDKCTIIAYAISGLTAAIGAIILTSRLLAVHTLMVTNLELDAISASVIGGVSLFGGEGSVSGVFIGALVIGIINNGLNLMGVSPYFQQVVKGVIIFMAVFLDVQRKKARH